MNIPIFTQGGQGLPGTTVSEAGTLVSCRQLASDTRCVRFSHAFDVPTVHTKGAPVDLDRHGGEHPCKQAKTARPDAGGTPPGPGGCQGASSTKIFMFHLFLFTFFYYGGFYFKLFLLLLKNDSI
jgi:hypothetical protein